MNKFLQARSQAVIFRLAVGLGRRSVARGVLLIVALMFGVSCAYAQDVADQPSVAFYYGNDVPVDMLNQFDWTVVEAAHMKAGQLETLQQYGTTAFAYVSLGEAEHWRGDAGVPESALPADNAHWNSKAADLTRSEWSDYIINRRIRPLWQGGYRAVFLDTLDSYRLFAKDDAAVAQQQAALVALIKRIRAEFPGIKLLLNRGFEVLDQVHEDVVGVAAESVYKGWNQGAQSYVDVSSDDSAYVRGKLQEAQERYGLPAIAIDYVAPNKRDVARQTARRIADAGLIPWVTDGALDQVGVGSIEPMPRKVLVLYDKTSVDHGDLANSSAHQYAAMPMEYMGYGAVYEDVNGPLPSDTLTGRYVGVITWFNQQAGDGGEYRQWLKKQIADGLRVAIFGDPGLAISGELGDSLGLQEITGISDQGLAIVDHDDIMGYEGMPERPGGKETGFTSSADSNRVHLTMKDGTGKQFSPVVTGDWGGIALSPWVLQQALVNQSRWIVNPFKFLKTALDLPDMPVPDWTTENGSRYWMNEIDGDAFVSRANFPGSPFNAEVMLDEILRSHKVPTTVSIIQGELGPDGLYPELTDRVEPIARKIFRLPWVEIGTHTFSHPFDWLSLSEGDLAGQGRTAAGFAFNLPIEGYRFSLQKEVAGSTRYINENLAPPGKKVQAVLWSGDSLPPEKALAIADRIGIVNINGGNTSVTQDNPSLTDVTAMLRPVGDRLQVYSPQINENVYTNDMTGPLWGFRRVIETYKITDKPRRLKPIDIYYHFYSASSPAALNALKEVYAYAGSQETLPVYASTYSRIARNWYDVGVARTLNGGWRITGATEMRTLRLPESLGWPDLQGSDGVVGLRDMEQGRYVALSGAPHVTLQLRNGQRDDRPYVARSNGRVTHWDAGDGAIELQMQSAVVPLKIELGGTAGCDVTARQARRSASGDTVTLSYSGTDSGRVRIACGG